MDRLAAQGLGRNTSTSRLGSHSFHHVDPLSVALDGLGQVLNSGKECFGGVDGDPPVF